MSFTEGLLLVHYRAMQGHWVFIFICGLFCRSRCKTSSESCIFLASPSICISFIGLSLTGFLSLEFFFNWYVQQGRCQHSIRLLFQYSIPSLCQYYLPVTDRLLVLDYDGTITTKDTCVRNDMEVFCRMWVSWEVICLTMMEETVLWSMTCS